EIEDAGVSGGGIGAAGPGPHGEAERVPNAIRVDARAHGGETSADVGIAGVAATGGRIDAQHLARQAVDPLRSERADVLGGGGLARTIRGRIETAGVHLTVVGAIANR